jgi:metal-dependent amidase/aminoacylase/carboxypeptidase family protein
MASEFVMQLQTIVSRQENPRDPTVVTVGDIHGGTKRNIIPDEVKMEITARAFSEPARQIILEGIRRTAQGVALSAGVPADRAPIVDVIEGEATPPMYNDPALATRLKVALTKTLGPQHVVDEDPVMASEDFGLFALDDHKIPAVLLWLGAMEPGKYAAAQAVGKMLPGLHTNHFQPDPEPTLRTGVTAMTAAAIALLQR